MMLLQTIKEQHQYITKLICEKRIKEAIVEVKEFLVNTNNWLLQNKLEEVETSYSYMLNYMRQSLPDPKRTEMQIRLLREILSIADQGKLARVLQEPYRPGYIKARNELESADVQYTLDNILLELEAYTENYAVASLLKTEESENELNTVRRHHEKMQALLFKKIWSTPFWTSEEEETAKKILNSVLISEFDLCLFVSAITLGLTEYFDIRKVTLLFDAYDSDNNQINQRALVGLAIVAVLYHSRMPFYPEITSRLSLLAESDTFAQELNRVQIQMLLSKDTDKINKKMQEEIIPEMIKNANTHNLRINPDENNEDDFNPDWAQEIENSPLADKIREMSELQMEGADVYMSTFAYQKGYPFFRSINNWFYPFDKQHSLVVKEFGDSSEKSVIDLILESAFFCDSDKYSLLFTMMHIPKAHRDMMTQQLSGQQMDELMNEKSSGAMKSFTDKREFISNQYIHNLYRFFKVYPYHQEFVDIFNEPIRLNETAIFREMMYNPFYLRQLVDFLFRKEHYVEAIEVYQILSTMESDSAEIYQKLGYCYQKTRRFTLALEAYHKADMIKPDNVWTNRHLATCYRIEKEYAKAVFYYKKVEEVQPENRSLLYNIGSCLVELELFSEAIQYFFKLDFIEPDNIRTWRAIAWSSFMLNKHEQANKYYERILKRNGVAPDYLNAGHVVWSMGDMKKAIEYYTKSCELSGSKTLFLDIFNKDKEYLQKNGINDYDIALMYDLIQTDSNTL